jgi:hypothetical protein
VSIGVGTGPRIGVQSGPPWRGPEGLQLDGAGRPRSPSGGARAGSERAPSRLASGRRGRDLWTPWVGPAVG